MHGPFSPSLQGRSTSTTNTSISSLSSRRETSRPAVAFSSVRACLQTRFGVEGGRRSYGLFLAQSSTVSAASIALIERCLPCASAHTLRTRSTASTLRASITELPQRWLCKPATTKTTGHSSRLLLQNVLVASTALATVKRGALLTAGPARRLEQRSVDFPVVLYRSNPLN